MPCFADPVHLRIVYSLVCVHSAIPCLNPFSTLTLRSLCPADPTAMSASPSPSIPVVDFAVEAIIHAVDGDGTVVEEKDGVLMEF